jgi:hypothetical protein
MKKAKLNKTFAVSQILSLIIEIFAFSFILGGMAVFSSEEVKAEGFVSQGCCLEAKDGSICQEMNTADSSLCKKELLGTSCSTVNECQKGCCYDSSNGECAFNSPKEQCLENGGNWNYEPTCRIQQCILGCCILGENAQTSTYKECVNSAKRFNFEINFQALDSDGSCNSKIGLDKTGACVIPSSDYSGENDCKITLKRNCQTGGGVFHENYLCTSKKLDTNCFKAKNTTCLQDKDEIYYVDSCGNPANIYDASKYDDENYWEQTISKELSCSSSDENCGNCNYKSGSFCQEYRKNKDEKPEMGNYVCRDLNCKTADGIKKHGESWCVSDYPFNETVFPVGTRQYRAVCMNGEIRVEPCADFNQEICVEKELRDNTKTEAKCQVNPWRSCLFANDKSTGAEIKEECEKNEYCILFNDYYSNRTSWNETLAANPSDLLLRSDGQILASFDYNMPIEQQGAANANTRDLNGILPHCVPKFAPGFVFWKETQDNNYGGSYIESKYICNIGNFNCISPKTRGCSLTSGFLSNVVCWGTFGLWGLIGNPSCSSWSDEQNWECNINGEHQTVRTNELPKLVAAFNERCRSVGSCGVNTNIAGKIGETNNSFKITRAKMDLHGDLNVISSSDYVLPTEYLASLPKAIKKISSLRDIQEIDSITGLGETSDSSINPRADTNSLQEVEEDVQSSVDAEREASEQAVATSLSNFGMYTGVASLFSSALWLADFFAVSMYSINWNVYYPRLDAYASMPSASAQFASFLNAIGIAALGAAIGSIAGSYLGQAIIRNQHWSPGHEREFMQGIIAYSALMGAGIAIAIYVIQGGCSVGPYGCVVGIIVALVILTAYSIYENCINNDYDENEYYVLNYQCNPWEAPKENSCDLCNNDVRPCSEYRCRSLGEKCVYNNANGEPGICTEGSGDWTSATITPYDDALSEGLKYYNIQSRSVEIKKDDGKDIEAYTTVEFGIQTDKAAQCKIDNKITSKFEDMAVAMNIDQDYGCEAGNCVNQGTYHKVALSPYIPEDESGSATLGLKQGDNRFYIRCKSSAGQVNNAEFVINLKIGEGPDRTPPNIKSASPQSGFYLKQGANSSSAFFLVDEPSECRYSQQVNSRFEDMTKALICMAGSQNSYLGRWPCYTTFGNLSAGENKIYIQCKDHPELAERSESTRNINRNSYEYSINVCSTGLNITKISPEEQIVTGRSPISANLKVETSGCIDGGKATCSYKFGNGGSMDFLNTNSKFHSQEFTNLIAGIHKINITCVDEAGNSDTKTTIIEVSLDNLAPSIIRAYYLDNRKLVVMTDENSVCRYSTNSTLGCSFLYDEDDSVLMSGNQQYHEGYWKYTEDYYIKCRDKYNNTNLNCGAVIRTY